MRISVSPSSRAWAAAFRSWRTPIATHSRAIATALFTARAFRRLENKTQVFTPGLSDHFRNRLTHTIEVSQIARTVARVLGLG